MGMASASSGQGSAIKAGGAYVEISAKDSLSKALAGLKTKVQGFAAGLKTVGVAGAALGGAVLTPLTLLFKGGVDRAEEIDRLSKSLGFTVEQMQRLKYAADVAGVSLDDVMKDPGKFKRLMDEAPLMDANEIKAAVQANQEWRKSLISLQGAMLPVLQTIFPLIKAVGTFARANSGMLLGIGAAAAGLVAVGGILSVVGPGLLAMAGIVLKVVSALGPFKLGILGAFGALLFGTQSGKAALAGLAEAFRTMAATFGETWGSVVEAVKKGQLELAFKVAAAGIKAIWFGMLSDMGKAFAGWLEDNKAKLISLAAITSAVSGAQAGARFGAGGLLAGGLIGAGVGGGVTAFKIDELKGIGSSASLDAARKKADMELKQLQKQIADAPKKLDAPGVFDGESTSGQLAGRIAATRGAFRIADAGQQFGGTGNPVVKKLVDLIEVQKQALGILQNAKGLVLS